MSDPTVLLIDDDESILTVLEMRLRAGGWRVLAARDGEGALRALSEHAVDVALSDLRLECEDGLAVMERMHEVDRTLPVLILTAHGSIPNAVEAMHRGAFSYLTKPVDRDELFAQLAGALQNRRLSREVDTLRRAIEDRRELMGLLGASAGMRRVFELLEQFAPTRAPISLYGEPGSGKATAARALHQLSPRANRPFLVMDCGALPEAVLLSELFGVRGEDPRPSGLARAQGGTLFLKEITALGPRAQAALAEALQPSQRALDVRVTVSARERPGAGFHEGLAMRLRGAEIHLPPLRERGEDIELLARHFLAREAARRGRTASDGALALRFSASALLMLRRHPWPGNVAELHAAVARAAERCADGLVLSGDLMDVADDSE